MLRQGARLVAASAAITLCARPSPSSFTTAPFIPRRFAAADGAAGNPHPVGSAADVVCSPAVMVDKSPDSDVMFSSVWRELVAERGLNHMVFPKEIVFLMGAPASGKGTNTQFILQARGITAPPLTVSKLLQQSQKLKEIMDSGRMVDDQTVTHVLLSTLLDPRYSNGVLVDGFPRTPLQVDIVKQLRDHMLELRASDPTKFPRPIFRMTVLYVDEGVSVERQIKRGQNSEAVRTMMADSGVGVSGLEPRATDTDFAKAKLRYNIFRQHLPTLVSLRKEFPFHMISGHGPQETVRNRILRQFAYQSSLELDGKTFDLVNSFPTVKTLTANARQNLVRRLDSYTTTQTPLFAQVMEALRTEFLPRIDQNAISGRVTVQSSNPIFQNPVAVNIALDVLSERGFRATYDFWIERIPERIDPTTYQVINSFVHRGSFEIRFEFVHIRYTDESWVDLEDQQ